MNPAEILSQRAIKPKTTNQPTVWSENKLSLYFATKQYLEDVLIDHLLQVQVPECVSITFVGLATK